MKHLLSIVVIVVVFSTGIYGCGVRTKYGSDVETFGRDGSYALGMDFGLMLKSNEIYPDMNDFIQGIMDILNDSTTRFEMEEANMIIETALEEMQEKQSARAEQEEIDYLAENSVKPGIIVTESGLQYEIIEEGTGEKPTAQDTVVVHYETTLTDGTVIDSTSFNDEPEEVPLDTWLPGLIEGVQLMNIGSTFRFTLPSDLAYGSNPRYPFLTLIFDVELIDIIQDQAE